MYLNTFIDLQENISGYGRGSKKPTGHVIITMPGMIRVYLQDLKDLADKEYICYALSKQDNKAIRLGAINTPSENKMTNWRIDVNNVEGKGVRADNIDCIAVVVEGDKVGNTDTVMVGYLGEKYLIAPLLEKGLPTGVEDRKDKQTAPKTQTTSNQYSPEKKTEYKPEKKQEQVVEKKQEYMPEKKQEQVVEKKQEYMPEKKQEQVMEKKQEYMPEKKQEQVVEKKVEEKPEKKAESKSKIGAEVGAGLIGAGIVGAGVVGKEIIEQIKSKKKTETTTIPVETVKEVKQEVKEETVTNILNKIKTQAQKAPVTKVIPPIIVSPGPVIPPKVEQGPGPVILPEPKPCPVVKECKPVCQADMEEQLKEQMKKELMEQMMAELNIEIKQGKKTKCTYGSQCDVYQIKEKMKNQMIEEIMTQVKGQMMQEVMNDMMNDMIKQMKQEIMGDMMKQMKQEIMEDMMKQIKQDIQKQMKQIEVDMIKNIREQLKVELMEEMNACKKEPINKCIPKPVSTCDKKDNKGQKEAPSKPECECHPPKPKYTSNRVRSVMESLERDSRQNNILSENIEAELKSLIDQGVSKEEILSKKKEIEQNISDLLNHRSPDNQEKDSLEDINEYQKETNTEQTTTKEEIDFLQQLENKLKSLQALLKSTVANDEVKAGIKDTIIGGIQAGVKEGIADKVADVIKNQKLPSKDKGDNLNPEEGEETIDEKNNTSVEDYQRVREIFETSAPIQPFEGDNQPIDWVRISLSELISIPQLAYEWATQPFITFSYHKFNHLILGREKAIEQYYIGIPDIYDQSRGHILEIDKIERFECRNAHRVATGEPGYWIAML